jgi:hypothetical protein
MELLITIAYIFLVRFVSLRLQAAGGAGLPSPHLDVRENEPVTDPVLEKLR